MVKGITSHRIVLDLIKASAIQYIKLTAILHTAPEIVLTGRMTKASDVFSFGMLVVELYRYSSQYKGSGTLH